MRCASSLMYEMPKSESSSRRHRSHRHRRRSPSAESEDRDDASLRKRRVEKLVSVAVGSIHLAFGAVLRVRRS